MFPISMHFRPQKNVCVCLPVESLQHRVIGQRDLIHEKHSSLLHGQHQGAVVPLKQPAVLTISLHTHKESNKRSRCHRLIILF